MRRTPSPLVAASAVWLLASCNDVAVEAIEATGVYRRDIREFPSTAGPQDVIEILIRREDFEQHIGEGGSLGLYASNCRSFHPGIHLGTRIGAGRPDAGRAGYWLQFVLIPLKSNEHYAHDWSRRLECVYVQSQPDYSPINYRSNFVRLTNAGYPGRGGDD